VRLYLCIGHSCERCADDRTVDIVGECDDARIRGTEGVGNGGEGDVRATHEHDVVDTSGHGEAALVESPEVLGGESAVELLIRVEVSSRDGDAGHHHAPVVDLDAHTRCRDPVEDAAASGFSHAVRAHDRQVGAALAQHRRHRRTTDEDPVTMGEGLGVRVEDPR
jgi:hypothetical protein